MVSAAVSNNNFLKKFQFSSLTNWSARYLLENSFSYNEHFELVPIGDFLIRNKELVEIQDGIEYRRVTIKINNNGVLQRDTEKGENIGTKRQYIVRKGQFIMSKIDARNGAFGLVPPELDGAIVTNDFPSFHVDNQRINTHFLVLITTTKEFVRFAQSCSSGTTNRQRINIDLFLQQRIPLPSVKEQNRIVSDYLIKERKADKQENNAISLKEDIEDYLFTELGITKQKENRKGNQIQTTKFSDINRWSYDYISKFVEIESTYHGKYPLIPLKNFLLSFQYGLSEKAHVQPNGIPMLRMNNILDSELITDKLKYLSIELDSIKKKYLLNKGDLLFNRTNSKELVGKTAIFDLDGQFTFASYLIRVVLDKTKVDIRYINLLFNSSILQHQKDLTSRQITGQANINSKEMQEFIFPIPPLPVQIKIADKISGVKEEISKLLSDAQENRKQAILEFEKEIFQPN